MEQAEDRYMKQLSKMQRPIPGSSLTNDPESPLPFERAPEFVNKKAALEAIFSNLIRAEVYSKVMEALIKGSTVMEITQVLLFEGFRQGKWNPDLFLMLIEPTAYMIMALAERADIEYKIDNEEEEEEEDSAINKKFSELSKKIKPSKITSGVIPKEIQKQIDQLPVESLLAPEEVPIQKKEKSLLTPEV